MVLEYVNGGEFFTHLRRAGILGNNTSRFYATSVVLIFEHIHKSDTIYRDLKPENLLLNERGIIKITDFGFAKKVSILKWNDVNNILSVYNYTILW
jgi:protein kinase A/protein kinase X